MAPRGNSPRQSRVVPALLIGGLSYAAWRVVGGPVVDGAQINVMPAVAAFGMGVSAIVLATSTLTFVADLCGYVSARIPTGRKGRAAFGTFKEVRRSLIKHGWGAYFGVAEGKPLFPDLEAVAFCLGPTGVGKTTKFILPGILALTGRPQVFYDYKSDITPQVAPALRGHGRRLRVINLGGLYEREVGQESDRYNVLALICETFFQPGGLEDVPDQIRELCFVLDPDDTGKSGVSDGNFWKSGSRRYLGFIILIVCLVEGGNASLGLCLQLANDKPSLLRHALWAAGRLEAEILDENGEPSAETARFPMHESPWAALHDPAEVENFAEFLRALASGIADILGQPDGKLADSILSTARESALSSFGITSRAAKLTSGTSTLRFSELKDEGSCTAIAVMIDPGKLAAHSDVLGVLHWAMLTELRRHERKTQKVYIWADEAGNLPWPRIADDLTTLRGYGVVPILAFQNFAHFEKRHGKAGLATLLSEAQVVLAMPGQRSPETLALLERRLSTQSVIAKSHNANNATGMFSMDGYSLQEDGRPLLNAEEIRRLEKGILWIGNHRPLLVDMPSVAEIAPFRDQLAPSPFYGVPYRKRIRLRIRPYSRSLLSWLGALLRRTLLGGAAS